MYSIKHLLLLALFGYATILYAGDESAVRSCVKSAIKGGLALDFTNSKQFYSDDYVKIAQDKKIFDRKLLENAAIYFKRLKDPELTFSELVKLNFMMKGQTLTDAQLANYRRLDSTERGKALVKQAQAQVQATHTNIQQVVNEVVNKCQYGPLFVKNDLAVCFYKLDYMVKVKGVLVLHKIADQWKIFREFSILDTEDVSSFAVESEVRNFVNESHDAARNLKNFTDISKYYSTESLAIFPDGRSMDYQQAVKQAEFYNMLQKGTPTMAQAAPLFMESCGQKITPEMLAHFADCDKSGKGKEWVMQYKNTMEKHRAAMKTSYQYSIENIFLFEDCALVIDHFYLPNIGNSNRISLLKKHQGKYLFYRSVSRKKPHSPQ